MPSTCTCFTESLSTVLSSICSFTASQIHQRQLTNTHCILILQNIFTPTIKRCLKQNVIHIKRTLIFIDSCQIIKLYKSNSCLTQTQTCTNLMVKTEWLRLDSEFRIVIAIRFLFCPLQNASNASSVDFTSTSVTEWTYMLRHASSLTIFTCNCLQDNLISSETYEIVYHTTAIIKLYTLCFIMNRSLLAVSNFFVSEITY